MDNCDLEKLCVSVGKLQPDFSPNISNYHVSVESSVSKVNLDVATSDCGASYKIRFGDGSRVIKLSDGLNKVEIEVVAEDGTIKNYCVEITKLSAKIAELSCESEVKLSELGPHLLSCPYKPTGELDAKVRHWEKKLHLAAAAENNVENLCNFAEDHLKTYNENIPKPGDLMKYQEDTSPLYNLEQAAIHFASAIRHSPKEPRLHFLLGMVLETTYYATEMYGLKKKVDKDSKDQSDAKSTSRQDDILAVCLLHGFPGNPTLENQLQALDKEYQQLRDQGQSSKADYVQTLYLWLSKKTGKDNSAAVQDEENYLNQALMKYLDAWSLSPDSWEYNLHVGRLLLLQGKHCNALQHLQTGLALRPLHAGLRFFTGLALLQQQKNTPEDTKKEAALWKEQFPSEPLSSINTQFLRGLLTMGQLQQKNILQNKAMSSEQVYHIVSALAAQSVSQCVSSSEASCQLEWVLLDAHFVLLQRLIHKVKTGADIKSVVAKRCQAIISLIRLTSITPCQELLDMQENACQLSVITTPRDSHALCLLGLAQLAQYDSNRSQVNLADACLSFQASIDLEGKPQKGKAPEELIKQKWWQLRQQNEVQTVTKSVASQPEAVKKPTTTGAVTRGRGRGRAQPGKGLVPGQASPVTLTKGRKATSKPSAARGRPGVAAKSSDNSTKRHNSSNMSKQECPAKPTDTVTVPTLKGVPESSPVNPKSHIPRLGLARALGRSEKHEQAESLYREVISMSPEVHDAYIELVQLLEPRDPQAALEVYCSYQLKPVAEQTFDDAFITGEIVRILMKLELFDHPQLGSSLVAYGKVMGLIFLHRVKFCYNENTDTLVKARAHTETLLIRAPVEAGDGLSGQSDVL
uniref:Cadherin-like beta-sandwich-like domain-containing protein n=1 Tax=Knipowitschia caucasica TaxID=637954 RepID=A0AAV2JJZ2_KNICA